MYSWIFGRRRSNAYFCESLVTETNKMVFGHRFKHIQHLHENCANRGLNTISLPNEGLETVGVHRSSMPCTPAATPAWEYSLSQARQFTEETFRDRLLIPKKGKRRAHVVSSSAAEPRGSDEKDSNVESKPPIPPGHPMLGGSVSSKTHEERMPKKVFVGNINFRVTQKQLRDFFSKFGKVVDCHIVYDHYKRRSKGIGFVTFQTTEAAIKAKDAQLEELTFEQREMRVLACEPRKRSLDKLKMKDRESSSEDEGELKQQLSTESAKSATIMEEGYFYINELPDDILIIIFAMLPIRERVLMERVCIRWRVLSVKAWRCSSSLKLCYEFDFFNRLNLKHLRNILQRCHHIKKLDLSQVPHSLDFRAVGTIVNLCPNLTSVNLTSIPTANQQLQQLAAKCTNLKVSFQNFLIQFIFMWWSLFNHCKQLSVIDVTNNSKMKGKCFQMLGPKLKIAVLNNCSTIQPINFSKLALRCPKIRSLSMNDCALLSDRCMKDICCNLRHLRILHLGGNFPDMTCSGLVWLGELQQLEELYIARNNLIDDLVLQAVCDGCLNLRDVNISCCNEGVTDLGLRALAQLTNIVNLDISYLGKITDDGVSEISKRGMLEKLIAKGCPSLSSHWTEWLSNYEWLETKEKDGVTFLFCTWCRNAKKNNPYASNGSTNLQKSALDRHANKKPDHLQLANARLLVQAKKTSKDILEVQEAKQATFIPVVSLCVELQEMNVSGCDNVENALLHSCIESLSIRYNNLKLKVTVGGTSCSNEEKEFEHEKLNIDWSDTSVEIHRPDYKNGLNFLIRFCLDNPNLVPIVANVRRYCSSAMDISVFEFEFKREDSPKSFAFELGSSDYSEEDFNSLEFEMQDYLQHDDPAREYENEIECVDHLY
ncbi:putative RNA-binding protein EEED8.10 [Nymphon striatum]|nr:putative RNA-binding protein EEED8.10 [Nymphon striatum]